MKAKALIPKKLACNPAAMARVIQNTLNTQALAIKVDFGVTVQTWESKPEFSIRSVSPYEREIGTDDTNYSRLNEGTPPHVITPRRGRVLVFRTPFRAKTVPNSISSGPGSKGTNTVFVTGPVNHPGTKPRQWDKAIKKKWDRLIGPLFQRAIDAEVN